MSYLPKGFGNTEFDEDGTPTKEPPRKQIKLPKIRDSCGLWGFSDLGGILIIIGLGLLLVLVAFYINDLHNADYLVTLDNFSCDQIWQLKDNWGHTTMNYFADRCN